MLFDPIFRIPSGAYALRAGGRIPTSEFHYLSAKNPFAVPVSQISMSYVYPVIFFEKDKRSEFNWGTISYACPVEFFWKDSGAYSTGELF